MLSLQQSSRKLAIAPPAQIPHLTLDSTLRELSLSDFQFESSQLGQEVAQTFQCHPLLPGVIITEHGRFIGIISRRRFLEQMSRPYGLELFSRRPLKSLYRFVQTSALILTADTSIVTAARRCLECSPDLLYEPITVELSPQQYGLLDVCQLLVAQLQIHELATQLMSQLYHKLEVANMELEYLAAVDGLTGVANRRRFDQYLQACWQQRSGRDCLFSLIMCDVDYFKLYNDTYGHQMGDQCLQQIATAIQQVVKRPADLVARYGGEEFAIILPLTPLDGAVHVAEAIRQEVRGLGIIHESSLGQSCVTLSIGVASMIPMSQLSPASLIAAADSALYQAKLSGRDRVIAYSDFNPL